MLKYFKGLMLIFFIFSCALCPASDALTMDLKSLNELKTNLVNEISQLRERLEDCNRTKIRSYVKFGFFFLASSLVYYLPFAPDEFVVEKEYLYIYVIAVLFSNSVVQRAFINAHELPIALRKKIVSKNNQLKILNELIALKSAIV
jgi:hypothetical protein